MLSVTWVFIFSVYSLSHIKAQNNTVCQDVCIENQCLFGYVETPCPRCTCGINPCSVVPSPCTSNERCTTRASDCSSGVKCPHEAVCTSIFCSAVCQDIKCSYGFDETACPRCSCAADPCEAITSPCKANERCTSRPTQCSTRVSCPHEAVCISNEICTPGVIVEGLGIFAHPTRCTDFMQCDIGQQLHEITCSDGLFYDPDKLTCVFPHDTDCLVDPCRTEADLQAYALPNDACNKYFVCKHGWTYERQCCGPGLSFDGIKGCVIDDTCQSLCNESVTTVGGPSANCSNIPDPDDDRQFKILDNGHTITMPCAAGALYEVATCQCSKLDLAYLLQMSELNICVPTVLLNFQGGRISSFEDKSGLNTYVEHKSVHITDDGRPGGDNRSVAFNGLRNQSIFFPRFTFSEYIPKVQLYILFKLTNSPVLDRSVPEAIVANSDFNACADVDASIAVYVERDINTVTAVVHTTLPLEITLSNSNLLPNDWNEVTVTYDGEKLSLILNQFPQQTQPTGNPARIVPVQCALHIGSGRNMQPFSGLIDTFEIQLC